MTIPKLECSINAYCTVYPSEDFLKVSQAIANVLEDVNIEIKKNSIQATSSNLQSLRIIYEKIHSRQTQKTYRRQLNHNFSDNSTWFYLNKQAAYAKTVALCEQAEESPLGPIKIILRSKNIERVIEWLISP